MLPHYSIGMELGRQRRHELIASAPKSRRPETRRRWWERDFLPPRRRFPSRKLAPA